MDRRPRRSPPPLMKVSNASPLWCTCTARTSSLTVWEDVAIRNPKRDGVVVDKGNESTFSSVQEEKVERILVATDGAWVLDGAWVRLNPRPYKKTEDVEEWAHGKLQRALSLSEETKV